MTTSDKERRRDRRERRIRRIRRIAVAIGTFLIVLSTLLYFFPIHSSTLEEQLEKELSKALNVPVSIDDLFIYTFNNRVEIHNLALSERPESTGALSSAPPFKIEKVILHVSFFTLPFKTLEGINKVEVYTPDDIYAYFDNTNNFGADGVPGLLIEDALSKSRNVTEETSATRPPFNIIIRNGRVHLTAAQAPLSPIEISIIDGAIRGNRIGDFSSIARGRLVYGNSMTPYSSEFYYNRDEERLTGKMHLDDVMRFNWPFAPGGSGPMLQVMAANLLFDRTGPADAREFEVIVKAKECRFPMPFIDDNIYDENLETRIRFLPPQKDNGGDFRVDPFEWKSKLGEVAGKLSFHASEKTTYTLQVQNASLNEAALNKVFDEFQKISAIKFDASGTSTTLNFNVDGSLRDGVTNAQGVWAMSDLSFRHPLLDTSVDIKLLRGSFTPDFATINKIKLGAFSTTLDGSANIKTEKFEPKSFHFEWDTTTGLSGLNELMTSIMAFDAPKVKLSGNVHTKGTFDIAEWTMTDPLEFSEFDVEINPDNAAYEVPGERQWRGSIVGGDIRIRPTVMEFRNIKLRQFDSLFNLNGTLYGDHFFWDTPQVALNLEGDLPLGDFFNIFSGPGKTKNTVSALGEMSVSAQLAGRLDQSSGLYWQAHGDFHEAAISFSTYPNSDGFNHLSGKWNFTGDAINIQNLSGEWGPFPFSLNGQLSPKQIRFNANSEFNLSNIRKRVPKIDDHYVLYGLARADANVIYYIPQANASTDTLDLKTPSTTLGETQNRSKLIMNQIKNGTDNVLDLAFREIKRPLPFLQSKDIDLNGDLKAMGINFGHVSMPVIISDIRGDMKFEKHRLFWTNATGKVGRSPTVSGPCEIDLSGPYVKMKFEGTCSELDLNQWIFEWPPLPAKTIPEDEITTRRLFTIDCAAIAEKVRFYKYDFFDFSGKLFYDRIKLGENKVNFSAQSKNTFEGKSQINGTVTKDLNTSTVYKFDIIIESAKLGEYLKIATPLQTDIKGNLSTRSSFNGVGGRSETFEGSGRFVIEDTEFLRFPVFEILADITKIDFLKRSSFSRVEGTFFVQDKQVHFPKIAFNNPLIKMTAKGTVDFDQNLDFELNLSYFKAISGDLPVLSNIMETVDSLIHMTLNFKVSGTLKEPVVTTQIL